MTVTMREGGVTEIVQEYDNYRNKDVIDHADRVAEEIVKTRNRQNRDKFFPDLIEALGLKTGVEIGVDKAEFSLHLLSKSNLNKLYCVDPWPDGFGSNFRSGAYDENGGNRMQDAINNLKSYIENGRAVMMKQMSIDAAKEIPDGSIDFCYIDGDHSLEGIYTDIYTWIHKVRPGGIISGHDYKDGPGSGMKNYWGEQLPYRVKTVVDNFCDQYGFKVNSIGRRKNLKSWWFVNTM